MLRYTGFDVLAPQISWSPDAPSMSDARRQDMLAAWASRLHTFDQEKALYFVPMSGFNLTDPSDPSKGMQVKLETLSPGYDSKYGVTVGQHLGKMVPKDSMLKPP